VTIAASGERVDEISTALDLRLGAAWSRKQDERQHGENERLFHEILLNEIGRDAGSVTGWV
jgi:hypothetical protein